MAKRKKDKDLKDMDLDLELGLSVWKLEPSLETKKVK
jgi:hypothetical protein